MIKQKLIKILQKNSFGVTLFLSFFTEWKWGVLGKCIAILLLIIQNSSSSSWYLYKMVISLHPMPQNVLLTLSLRPACWVCLLCVELLPLASWWAHESPEVLWCWRDLHLKKISDGVMLQESERQNDILVDERPYLNRYFNYSKHHLHSSMLDRRRLYSTSTGS